MQTRRTLVFSMLVFVLGLTLLMLGSPRQADAGGTLTEAEWKAVACSIDRHIQSMYDGSANNETGFIYTPDLYNSRVDNNGVGGIPDGTICGVGDNMANRPVLVDNFINVATLIPGTSIRDLWNSGSATIGGLSPFVLTALKAKVNAHREAGFSTDISVY